MKFLLVLALGLSINHNTEASVGRFGALSIATSLFGCSNKNDQSAELKKLKEENEELKTLLGVCDQALIDTEADLEAEVEYSTTLSAQLTASQNSYLNLVNTLNDLESDYEDLEAELNGFIANVESTYLFSWDVNSDCSTTLVPAGTDLSAVRTSIRNNIITEVFYNMDLYMLLSDEGVDSIPSGNGFELIDNLLHYDIAHPTMGPYIEGLIAAGSLDNSFDGPGPFLVSLTQTQLDYLDDELVARSQSLAIEANIEWSNGGVLRSIDECVYFGLTSVNELVSQ